MGINSRVGSILPSRLQCAILHGTLKMFTLQLSDFVLNEKNPIGSSRLSKLKRIFEGGDSLQLQFPAEDLGFRYVKGAMVSDSDNELDASELPNGRRRDYAPSAKLGSRLPHMNIQLLSNPSNTNIFSTLDLVPVEKVEFVLIISPVQDSYRLAQAAFVTAEQIKLPLKVCVVWPENTVEGVDKSATALTPWTNIVDVVEVKRSPTSPSLLNRCLMTDTEALLVRPDEHIAWRSLSVDISDPVLEMKQVFSKILGLTGSR